MRKTVLFIIFNLLFLPLVLHAQEFYSRAELFQKIKSMELISYEKMPSVFWYLTGNDDLFNQRDINIFYLAKAQYERHPENFNAVFNYATVIMSLNSGSDTDLASVQVDEAYRLLERAKKIKPDFLPLYEQQDYLLKYKIFGPFWFGAAQLDENAVALYQDKPDLARLRLSVQEKLIPSGKGDVGAAWQICTALGFKESAAKYAELLRRKNAACEAQIKAELEEMLRLLNRQQKDSLLWGF